MKVIRINKKHLMICTIILIIFAVISIGNKISYKTAGENIAGNSSNTKAVIAWMNSSGHKANILNSSYNYTGIGVVKSPKYGKIYVQMFIGK